MLEIFTTIEPLDLCYDRIITFKYISLKGTRGIYPNFHREEEKCPYQPVPARTLSGYLKLTSGRFIITELMKFRIWDFI